MKSPGQAQSVKNPGWSLVKSPWRITKSNRGFYYLISVRLTPLSDMTVSGVLRTDYSGQVYILYREGGSGVVSMVTLSCEQGTRSTTEFLDRLHHKL